MRKPAKTSEDSLVWREARRHANNKQFPEYSELRLLTSES